MTSKQEKDALVAIANELASNVADLKNKAALNSDAVVALKGALDAFNTELEKVKASSDSLTAEGVDLSDVAERLKTSVDALVVVEPPKTRGMLIGTSGGPGKSKYQDSLVAAAGVEPAVRRTYWDMGVIDKMIAQVKTDISKDSLPWVTIKFTPVTATKPSFPQDWQAVVDGKRDDAIRDIRDRLIALDKEIWVGFHHEPENDGPATREARAVWREAQRRCAEIFAEKPSKLKFWLTLMGYPQNNPKTPLDGTEWANLYPQGAKIDGVAYDIYNWYGVNSNTFGELPKQMDSLIAVAKEKGIMWGIAETALSDAAFDLTAKDGRGWMKRAVDYAAANGCAAFAYFDWSNSTATWPLRPGTAKAATFVELMKGSDRPY